MRRARILAVAAAMVCVHAPLATAHTDVETDPAAPAPPVQTHGADPRSVDAGPSGPPTAVLRTRSKVAARSVWSVWSSLPQRWCGEHRSTDDRQHELDNGQAKYHAIYAIPLDGADRLDEVANDIQADAFGASALLEATYGRSVRFDMGTSCGRGYLDITVVRLPLPAVALSTLGDTPGALIDAVQSTLDATGLAAIRPGDTLADLLARDRNWVVWLDAPAPRGMCGQGTLYHDPSRGARSINHAGGHVAIIFPSGSGFCGANTVRHEIGHTLGALQPNAPNNADGSHCSDAFEDTMCVGPAPRRSDGAEAARFFDYGNDDYWSPVGAPLPWWTVDLSRFLCPDAECNVPPESLRDVPDPPPAVAGGGSEAAQDASPQLESFRATRAGRSAWRWRARVGGSGLAALQVRCGSRVLVRRTVDAPLTVGGRVSCRTRPRASALPGRAL